MPKARAKKAHRKTPKSYTTEDWKKIYRKSKRHVPASMRGGTGGGGARHQWWMPLAHTGETYLAAGGIGYLFAKKGPDYRPVANAPVELLAAVGAHGLAFVGSTMGWGKAFAPHLHALGDGAIAAHGVKMGMMLGVDADQKKGLKKPRLIIDMANNNVKVAELVEPAKAEAPAVGADEYGADEYGADEYGYAGAESIAADPEG